MDPYRAAITTILYEYNVVTHIVEDTAYIMLKNRRCDK